MQHGIDDDVAVVVALEKVIMLDILSQLPLCSSGDILRRKQMIWGRERIFIVFHKIGMVCYVYLVPVDDFDLFVGDKVPLEVRSHCEAYDLHVVLVLVVLLPPLDGNDLFRGELLALDNLELGVF